MVTESEARQQDRFTKHIAKTYGWTYSAAEKVVAARIDLERAINAAESD